MLTRLAKGLRRIPRGWYTALLIVYWLGMTGWLVFREAYPGLFEQATTGYRAMFSGGLLVMDRWMKITFQGTPIGYSHTSVDVHDKDPLAQLTFANMTILNLNLRKQRNGVVKISIITFVLLMVSAVGSYQAFHYTESVEFCGQLCHKVMSPEYTTYMHSPQGLLQPRLQTFVLQGKPANAATGPRNSIPVR